MDKSYALHIAQAIRQKKAMKAEPKEELDGLGEEDELPLDLDEEPTLDEKTKRRERLKAILSR